MKIVIVEDHTIIRQILEYTCRHCPICELVGLASQGAKAIELVRLHRPEVMILDLGLPDINGFVVARAARRIVPGLRVLVLTSHLLTYVVYGDEQEGIHGFMDKRTARPETLQAALQCIVEGKTSYSSAYVLAREQRRAAPRAFGKLLSTTEVEVLMGIAHGLNDEEIAAQLGMKSGPDQHHRGQIFPKLRFAGHRQADRLGLRAGVCYVTFDPVSAVPRW